MNLHACAAAIALAGTAIADDVRLPRVLHPDLELELCLREPEIATFTPVMKLSSVGLSTSAPGTASYETVAKIPLFCSWRTSTSLIISGTGRSQNSSPP